MWVSLCSFFGVFLSLRVVFCLVYWCVVDRSRFSVEELKLVSVVVDSCILWLVVVNIWVVLVCSVGDIWV